MPDRTINKGGRVAHRGCLIFLSTVVYGGCKGCALAPLPPVVGELSQLAPLPPASHTFFLLPPACPHAAVGEFRKLALLAEADGHLRQKLQQVRGGRGGA